MLDPVEKSPADMRAEYSRGELHRKDLLADPIQQFAAWFTQAWEAKVIEPNAMSLSTVSAAGQPSLRTVLLKQYDASGFVFFTNLHSRKSQEIEQNSRVAMLFPWVTMARQVIITGAAERVSAEEARQYFLTRPRGSQIGAWVSVQSSVIESRKILDMELEKIQQKFAGSEVPLPPFWGGYRVRPDAIEFWQGRENRLHDRFRYVRQSNDAWTIDRLSP